MKLLARFGPAARALGKRNYRLYILGSMSSSIGSWIQRIGIGWLTWELTHSPTWLGIIATCDVVPALALGPLAGAMADRVDKLRLTKFLQVMAMGQAATLCTLTYLGWINIYLLFGLALLQGIILSLQQPVRLAIVPSLVGREDLSPAIALNSLSFNLARFLGPAIAGPIIVWGGVAPAFGVNAASFLVFLWALSRVVIITPERTARPSAGLRALPGEIVTGYLYAARHPGIGMVLIGVFFVSFFTRPFQELLPAFADHVFNRGAEALAMMTSAIGLGAMVAGIWLAQRPNVLGLTRLLTISAFLTSISLLMFASISDLTLALPFLAVCGFTTVTVAITAQTLVQSSVTPAMRGRALSLYGMINRGGPSLGALAMGAISEYTGLHWPVAAGAVICIVAWLVIRTRRKAMRQALEIDPPDDGEPQNSARATEPRAGS